MSNALIVFTWKSKSGFRTILNGVSDFSLVRQPNRLVLYVGSRSPHEEDCLAIDGLDEDVANLVMDAIWEKMRSAGGATLSIDMNELIESNKKVAQHNRKVKKEEENE